MHGRHCSRDPRGGDRLAAAAFIQTLYADVQGFSLHAAVRCAADERNRLEQLCRYISRPALANAPGRIALRRIDDRMWRVAEIQAAATTDGNRLGLFDTCPECHPRPASPRWQGRCRTSLEGGNRGARGNG